MDRAPHEEVTLDELELRILERPNGPRVLRLLRELPYVDGRLSSSLRAADEFPRVTAELAAFMGMVAWLTT